MDLMDLDGFDGSQLVSQPCMRAPHQQEDGSPPAPQQRWEERWAPTLSLASPPLQALPLLPGPGTASIGWSRVRGRVRVRVRRRMDGRRVEIDFILCKIYLIYVSSKKDKTVWLCTRDLVLLIPTLIVT